MDKRWQVSEDGVTWLRTVSVLNGAKVTITESRDLDAGQVFFRKKMNTALEFGGDDYLYFLSFERRASGRCQSLYIRCQLKCASNWSTFWTGEFSTGSGKWDLGRCLFEVKPETVDKYSCLLKKQTVKHNLLQVEEVTVNVVEVPSLEFLVCVMGGGAPICLVDTTGYTAIHTWIPIVAGPTLAVLWREYGVTECVAGNPVPPPGAGWTMQTDNCAVDGTSRWYRTPLISWTWGDPQAFYGTDGFPIPPPDTCIWQEIGSYDFGISPPGVVPFYICLTDGTPTVLEHARPMEGAAEYLIEQSGCDLEGVRSDFFGWDAQGDAPGYVAGENYVTGETTNTEAMMMVQKSDVIDPSASNPATIGEMTFKEFMSMLRIMFDCYWDIDANGYVRVEHWIYWEEANGWNLTTRAKTDERIRYTHLSESIPSVERVTFMEALSRDFVGKDIQYSGPCVSPQATSDVKEYSPGKVTTDVSMVLSDPTAIAKDGFVVLATSFNGTDYDTIIDTGAITGNYVTNAPLSTANLQRDFWTWTRYLPTGNMNGADVTFDGFRPNIEQTEVRTGMCCDALQFDPRDKLTTALGERLGDKMGIVEEVSYDLFIDRMELTLRYSY